MHGGVAIKLKLGKDEPVTSTDNSISTSEQKTPETKVSPKPAEQPEKKPEPERKIIKFDTPEKSAEQKKAEPLQSELKKKTTEIKQPDTGKTGSIPDVNKIISEKAPGASADAAREELEQRRTILQNMKDFDFQIKKNQEDITNLVEKIENLSKDLDDLVSLYEIVSEQMNPFVGLSKVTKKRLDVLENITNEVDSIKTRIGDLESLLEKSGRNIEELKKTGFPSTTIKTHNQGIIAPETTTGQSPTISPIVAPIVKPISATEIQIQQSIEQNLSEEELDEILSRSLEALLVEQNIDSIINEFFLSLK